MGNMFLREGRGRSRKSETAHATQSVDAQSVVISAERGGVLCRGEGRRARQLMSCSYTIPVFQLRIWAKKTTSKASSGQLAGHGAA